MNRFAVVGLAVLVAGCSSGSHPAIGPTATLLALQIPRAQITKIEVGALPVGPTANYSPRRPHWRAIINALPAQLPAPIASNSSCTYGPTFRVYLADGSEFVYDCQLPPAIRTGRDLILSFS